MYQRQPSLSSRNFSFLLTLGLNLDFQKVVRLLSMLLKKEMTTTLSSCTPKIYYNDSPFFLWSLRKSFEIASLPGLVSSASQNIFSSSFWPSYTLDELTQFPVFIFFDTNCGGLHEPFCRSRGVFPLLTHVCFSCSLTRRAQMANLDVFE